MQNILIKIGAVLFVVLLLGSCKKYDEGPWISFRSAEKRLIGEYKLTKCTIDGEDVSSYLINDSVSFEMEFRNDVGYYFNMFISTGIYERNHNIYYIWSFKNKNTEVSVFDKEVTYDDYLCCVPPVIPFTDEESSMLEIKRLKNNELIYEINYANKNYRYEFDKKK